MIYQANPGQHIFGHTIGILVMDARIPRPPGDVGNAATFPFPVRHEVVAGASLKRLIQERDPELLEPFITAGQRLAVQGVRAITTTCGFMILFQKAMSAALPVPVFTSSLLQLPFIHAGTGADAKVGILTADAGNLTPEHLRLAGGDPERIVAAGMENCPAFRSAVLEGSGILDFSVVQKEVVQQAEALIRRNRDIRTILLECANLPPYAVAVQQAVGLPVFDFNTMISYIFSTLVRREYRE